jgi:hypothetical protein
MKDTKTAVQIIHQAQADRAHAKRQAVVQRSDDILAEEARRVAKNAAKTSRLRALREATGEAATLVDRPATKPRTGKTRAPARRAKD